MQPVRKGTLVYTRIQPLTGREITVRKQRQIFTLFVDNQEMEQYPTQQTAMQAADALAENANVIRILPSS